MKHKWTDPEGIKSICENCGLIRTRLTYLPGEPSVIYYNPNKINTIEYKVSKCKGGKK